MTDKKCRTIDDKYQMTYICVIIQICQRMWNMHSLLHVVSFTKYGHRGHADYHGHWTLDMFVSLRCELYILVQERTLASHKRILVHL